MLRTISPAPRFWTSSTQRSVSHSVAGALFVARELIDPVFAGRFIVPGVDPDHDALDAESVCEARDERGVGKRRGVDGNFVGAEGEKPPRVLNRLDAPGNAEGNVDRFGDARNPALVDDAAVRRGGDVVEDEFVCAFLGIAFGKRDDVADDFMTAELHALDDLSVADVEAGNDAFGEHGSSFKGKA